MSRRWPLLALTAGAAGLSAVAGAFAQADNGEGRFGTAIKQELSERDRAAAARQRQLDLREQAQRAAERRLGAAPAAQVTPPAPTPAPAPNAEPSEEERLDDLARIYQAMKPKAAAPIFEELSLEVQVKVTSRMRERSAAQIMAAMNPKKAAALTMAIAKRQTSYSVLSSPARRPEAPAARR